MKDPSYAIPKGTLGAIGLTYLTYSYFAIQTGFIFLPQASGVPEEYRYSQLEDPSSYNNTEILAGLSHCDMEQLPRFDNCNVTTNLDRDCLVDYFNGTADYYRQWNKGKGCEHGSALDQMTMTYTSFTGYLRYAGGFSASLSSAIASLVGAPRVLQVSTYPLT